MILTLRHFGSPQRLLMAPTVALSVSIDYSGIGSALAASIMSGEGDRVGINAPLVTPECENSLGRSGCWVLRSESSYFETALGGTLHLHLQLPWDVRLSTECWRLNFDLMAAWLRSA